MDSAASMATMSSCSARTTAGTYLCPRLTSLGYGGRVAQSHRRCLGSAWSKRRLGQQRHRPSVELSFRTRAARRSSGISTRLCVRQQCVWPCSALSVHLPLHSPYTLTTPDRCVLHHQHEAPDHRPAHAVNVLVALSDIPLVMGPTEVAPGTHRLTNHLHPERGWLRRDDMLYQSELEYTPEHLRTGIPPSSSAASAAAVSCTEREGLAALSAGAKDPDVCSRITMRISWQTSVSTCCLLMLSVVGACWRYRRLLDLRRSNFASWHGQQQ